MKHQRWELWFVAACLFMAVEGLTADEPPRSLDPHLTIELFAEHPQIRTPTGIDVDAYGRVWVIESNTHFRPEGYDGHPTDRLLILTDTTGDGRCDHVQTFADGFTFAMSVAVRPVWMEPIEIPSAEVAGDTKPSSHRQVIPGQAEVLPQQVVLCTRHDIFLLEDHDLDDVCDRRTPLIHLETGNRYPHNGLAGLAFDSEGWMYFGLGQNHGEPYRMISLEGRQSLHGRHSLPQPPFGGGETTDIAATFDVPLQAKPAAVMRQPQQIFLATRREILLLEDVDGDDLCDSQTILARLDTRGNYPHNGLAGFAFDAEGWMYFGFGENLGEDYHLISREAENLVASVDRGIRNLPAESSGVIIGGGEGGSIFRMRPDGTGLTRWATGYWNPHASCTDAFGRLFTVDNDPDSRPPCRLIHVIEGGDSGYRFRNGRRGLHPFTSWNGEIPGTLPMVSGTGEAPSGVVPCEHPNWPETYAGSLLVTSWGDHRIDRFQLFPQGASFVSLPEPVITGGENFRPVGIALAPDGSLYCSDWVLKDYNLHGQGRVWRVRPRDMAESSAGDRTPHLEILAATEDRQILREGLDSQFLPERRLAARRMGDLFPNLLLNVARDRGASERTRYEALMALVLNPDDNRTRVIKSELRTDHGPFDSIQTLLARHFEETPPLGRVLQLLQADTPSNLEDSAGLPGIPYGTRDGSHLTDPEYILFGVSSFTPLMRAMGAGQSPAAISSLNRLVEVGDPFIESRMVFWLAHSLTEDQFLWTLQSAAELTPRLRSLVLLAARAAYPQSRECVKAAFTSTHAHAEVLRLAVQWAAEEQLVELRPHVEAVLTADLLTADLFLATVAALELLDGKPPRDFDQTPAGKYVLPLLTAEDSSLSVKRLALRLADPNAADVQILLEQWSAHPDPALRREVLYSMGRSTERNFQAILSAIAADDTEPLPIRVSAVDALAGQLGEEIEPGRSLLLSLVRDHDADVELRRSAMRSLRGLVALQRDTELAEELKSISERNDLLAEDWFVMPGIESPPISGRPESETEWMASLLASAENGGDAFAGERVFFHPHGPGCARCHTVQGRGGEIGPDLSGIGRGMSRQKILESILHPSREVSPQYTTWQMATVNGEIHVGMIVLENEGRTVLGTIEGELIDLPTREIELRIPQTVSVMPEHLEERMTTREFLDLLAFLESLTDG